MESTVFLCLYIGLLFCPLNKQINKQMYVKTFASAVHGVDATTITVEVHIGGAVGAGNCQGTDRATGVATERGSVSGLV